MNFIMLLIALECVVYVFDKEITSAAQYIYSYYTDYHYYGMTLIKEMIL